MIGERRLKSTVGEGSGYFRLSRLTLHNGYYGRLKKISSNQDSVQSAALSPNRPGQMAAPKGNSVRTCSYMLDVNAVDTVQKPTAWP